MESGMGVHVTLTGVRGLIAPFAAIGLYEMLNGLHAGAGAWVFAVCLILTATGALGFGLMRRSMATPAEMIAVDSASRAQSADR